MSGLHTTPNWRHHGYVVLAVMSLILAAVFSTAATHALDRDGLDAAHTQDREQLDQHCPDHATEAKDDNPAPGAVNSVDVDGTTVWLHYGDDGESVRFFADEDGDEPLTVRFCIKAGDRAGGEEVGHEGHVSWENGGGQTPQISNVVVYEIIEPECPGELDLTPGDATNDLGDTHEVTATVTDGDGNPCEGVEVRFEVDPAEGADPSATGTDVTDATGKATFSYTKAEESSDTITACTTEDGDAPAECDTTTHVFDTATKQWAGCPDELDLTPGDATNKLGDTHEVTATVTDDQGDPCEGVEVRFEVDPEAGADPSTGTDVTDATGQATFSYTRAEESSDTITACTTGDGDAPAECDTTTHVFDTATKEWVTNGGAALSCRANLLAAALGGNALPNLFEANPDSDPCEPEQDGLLVALSPVLGDGGLGLLNDENQLVLADPSGSVPGFVLVDAAWADTDRNDDSTMGSADSGVLHLIVNDGSDDQIVVEAATSSSETDCDGGTETTATLLSVTIAGTEIPIPDEHTILLDPALFDVVELHLEDGGDEGADEGPDDTGAQAVDASALMDNVLAGVADSETGCTQD